MTRINLVPPEELMDQHLFAEFREIKMIPMSLRRSVIARGIDGALKIVPPEFTLNAGHVSFFYNKGQYLHNRYEMLRKELSARGINFDTESLLDPLQVLKTDPRFMGDYQPTPEAFETIRTRIAEKIAMKPHWYRYYGRPGGTRL